MDLSVSCRIWYSSPSLQLRRLSPSKRGSQHRPPFHAPTSNHGLSCANGQEIHKPVRQRKPIRLRLYGLSEEAKYLLLSNLNQSDPKSQNFCSRPSCAKACLHRGGREFERGVSGGGGGRRDGGRTEAQKSQVDGGGVGMQVATERSRGCNRSCRRPSPLSATRPRRRDRQSDAFASSTFESPS